MNRDPNNLYFCLNMVTSSCLNMKSEEISGTVKKRKMIKIFNGYMWADQDVTDAVCHYGQHGLVTNVPIPFKKFRLNRKINHEQ